MHYEIDTRLYDASVAMQQTTSYILLSKIRIRSTLESTPETKSSTTPWIHLRIANQISCSPV